MPPSMKLTFMMLLLSIGCGLTYANPTIGRFDATVFYNPTVKPNSTFEGLPDGTTGHYYDHTYGLSDSAAIVYKLGPGMMIDGAGPDLNVYECNGTGAGQFLDAVGPADPLGI